MMNNRWARFAILLVAILISISLKSFSLSASECVRKLASIHGAPQKLSILLDHGDWPKIDQTLVKSLSAGRLITDGTLLENREGDSNLIEVYSDQIKVLLWAYSAVHSPLLRADIIGHIAYRYRLLTLGILGAAIESGVESQRSRPSAEADASVDDILAVYFPFHFKDVKDFDRARLNLARAQMVVDFDSGESEISNAVAGLYTFMNRSETLKVDLQSLRYLGEIKGPKTRWALGRILRNLRANAPAQSSPLIFWAHQQIAAKISDSELKPITLEYLRSHSNFFDVEDIAQLVEYFVQAEKTQTVAELLLAYQVTAVSAEVIDPYLFEARVEIYNATGYKLKRLLGFFERFGEMSDLQILQSLIVDDDISKSLIEQASQAIEKRVLHSSNED